MRRCVLCAVAGSGLCASCRGELRPAPPGPGLALWTYDGAAKELVMALKHGSGRAVAQAVAPDLARALHPFLPSGVTWAPTSVGRRGRRGFDQSELLARAIGVELALPVRRQLERRRGTAQHGQSRQQRLAGPEFLPVAMAPRVVAVVDDVITTGATMDSAVRCLTVAGAEVCVAVALCRVM